MQDNGGSRNDNGNSTGRNPRSDDAVQKEKNKLIEKWKAEKKKLMESVAEKFRTTLDEKVDYGIYGWLMCTCESFLVFDCIV